VTQFLKGKIIYQSRIYRRDLQANPDVIYVFGDNSMRYGMGGQAGEMRGEPNAVGIATKWDIRGKDSDYYSDANFAGCTEQIREDWKPVYEFLQRPGSIVIVPMDGLGTGLSELPTRAPRVYRYLCGLGLGAQPKLSDQERELRRVGKAT
jgi:hypothetical protein